MSRRGGKTVNKTSARIAQAARDIYRTVLKKKKQTEEQKVT